MLKCDWRVSARQKLSEHITVWECSRSQCGNVAEMSVSGNADAFHINIPPGKRELIAEALGLNAYECKGRRHRSELTR